jgi:outer membrane protein assembly factor BamB
VSLQNYVGDKTYFEIKAKSSRVFEKPIHAWVVDKEGLLDASTGIGQVSDLEYVLSLQTRKLPAGTYTTTLEVRLCEDDGIVCAKPLPGSPWHVPLTLKVAPAADAQQRLTIKPETIELDASPGTSTTFAFEANLNPPVDSVASVFFGVFDNTGLLAQTRVVQPTHGHYDVEITTSPTLGVGVHTTTLEGRLCYDSPTQCKEPVVGSPWRVPLKITVKPDINLTPLSTIPSLLPWTNPNGNASQNAYVPASFAAAAFTRRWQKTESTDSTLALTVPVIENGRLFSLRSSSTQREIVAMSEFSGEELWRYQLDASAYYDVLATGNGKVFVRMGETGGTYLLAFDQAAGRLISKTPLGGPSEAAKPTVLGETVYVGRQHVVEKVNAATGTSIWNNGGLPFGGELWTVVADASRAYTVKYDQVLELDAADGNVLSSLQEPAITANMLNGPAIVQGGKTVLLSSGYQLFAFDFQAHMPLWKVQSTVLGPPVLANGTVYTLTNNSPNLALTLEARSAVTGVLQWKSTATGDMFYDGSNGRLIVAANLAFVSSEDQTMAFDLATHAIVWSYPVGGKMALSDQGVLYIAGRGGKLVAINLR